MTVVSSPMLSAAATSLDRRTRMLRTAMGPLIAAALDDPDVVEVMLNPDGVLWLDRLSAGRAHLGTLAAADGERIIRLVAAHVGQEVHRNKPLLSAELPETGERFEGVLPPVVAGPTFALRKRAAGVIPLHQYVADGILSAAQAEHLRVAVRDRQNILVAGGTSSGKTTLANALLAEVAGSGDRVLVVVPFALWNKTAFLAEKVLGNVVASGIKVLVLAVIVGIGSGLFAEFQAMPDEPSIDHALVVMLASLALLGLGIFGQGIATGLVSGAPQLGAGAAAGTALGAAGMAAGAAAVTAGVGGAVLAGARMAPGAARLAMGGARSLAGASSSAAANGAPAASDTATAPAKQPDWARRLQRRQQLSQATSTVAHTLRGGDGGGSSPGPQIRDPSNS